MTVRQVGGLVYRACIVATCLVLSATGASALTDEEVFREFRFNFISPGARALGMGGAYVAAADDATAAEANPAGLDYISSGEFFIELRTMNNDTRIFESEFGSLEVDTTTGDRDLPFLSLTSVSETDTETLPSFVSFVWPFKMGQIGRRLTLAGSRLVVLSQDRALESSSDQTEVRTAFESFPNTVVDGRVEAYSVAGPVTGQNSTEIVYWNAGTSLEVHPDFSVGVTLSLATLDVESNTVTLIDDPLELLLDPSHPRLPAQPTADVLESIIDDTDTGFAWNVGVHWHPDSVFASGVSPWRFGAVFRKGADFEVEGSTLANGVTDTMFTTAFVVPDRYSIGASYQAGSRWTLAFEIERIEYSDMLEDFQSGLNFLTSDRMSEFFPIDPDQPVTFDVDDGTVPRLGGEYVFSTKPEIAVQLGYFRLPDSRIRLEQYNAVDDAVNDVYLDAFRGAEEEDHFTAGVGFTWGRSSFHIAGDFSEDDTHVVGSYIFRLEQR
jgi:hypothetical protein